MLYDSCVLFLVWTVERACIHCIKYGLPEIPFANGLVEIMRRDYIFLGSFDATYSFAWRFT